MIVNWRDADSQVLLADDCYRAAQAVTKTTDDSCELSNSGEFSKNRVNSVGSLVFASLSLPFSLFLLFFLALSSSVPLFFSGMISPSSMSRVFGHEFTFKHGDNNDDEFFNVTRKSFQIGSSRSFLCVCCHSVCVYVCMCVSPRFAISLGEKKTHTAIGFRGYREFIFNR